MIQETSPHLKGLILLRDRLLPNLLNEDEGDILYWTGKDLARAYPFASLEEILQTMTDLSFGSIELVEKKRSTYLFHLTGDVVTSRYSANKEADFHLETGFLSEAVQMLTHIYTEGTFRLLKKGTVVEILLKTDKKEAAH